MKGLLPLLIQRPNQACSTVIYFFIVAMRAGTNVELFAVGNISHVSDARNQSVPIGGALGV
jgi:hypothetical protein